MPFTAARRKKKAKMVTGQVQGSSNWGPARSTTTKQVAHNAVSYMVHKLTENGCAREMVTSLPTN